MKKIFFLTILFAIYSHSNIIGSEPVKIDCSDLKNIYKVLFLIVPYSNISPGDSIDFSKDSHIKMPFFEILLKLRDGIYYYDLAKNIENNHEILIEYVAEDGTNKTKMILYKNDTPRVIYKLATDITKYLSKNSTNLYKDVQINKQYILINTTEKDHFTDKLNDLLFDFFLIKPSKTIAISKNIDEFDKTKLFYKNLISEIQKGSSEKAPENTFFEKAFNEIKDFDYKLFNAIEQSPLENHTKSLIDALELATTLNK